MKTFKITKILGNIKKIEESVLAEEALLTITAGDQEIVTLSCSPIDLEDLARGFLFTSGLIKKAEDILDIQCLTRGEKRIVSVDLADNSRIKELAAEKIHTSGGGKVIVNNVNSVKISSDFKIKSGQIQVLMAEFLGSSQIYLKTGGVHSAAVTDGKEMLIFKEDIGRHNAIDKVIGRAFLEGISLKDKSLITSGRISSEVVMKAHNSGIPIIISKAAPMNEAVRLAKEAGITLIGFVRRSSMNIYSYEERVI
ncbi:MAG: formate dehydrogenase accessory sulfurtransferase FdhD [Candidatus Omnitrophota bacterium]